MKVVLFCGGLGMRLREYSEVIPKPMIVSVAVRKGEVAVHDAIAGLVTRVYVAVPW